MNARRVTGVSVLAIWLVMVGWHVRREYVVPEAERLAAGARALAPGTHWFIIRMGDVPIGIAQSRLDTLPNGYVFNDEITLDVPALGQVHRSLARTRIDLGPALELVGFEFGLTSRIGAFSVAGRAEGDSAVAVTMNAGGGPQESRIEVSDGLLLDAALSLRMAASGALREGNELTVRVFDPSSMSERDVVVRVGARETIVVPDSARLENGRWVATVLDTVPVFRVEQRFGGVSIANYIDEDGQIVRAESPLGFTIERTYYELARQEWQSGRSAELALGYGALIEGTAISANVDVADVAARPSLSVRLGGVDLEGFDLEGGRQALRGDTLVITRETVLDAGYVLPYAGAGTPAAQLEATPLIQADDPRIVATARRITEGSTDPLEVAHRLNAWVYDRLEKDVTLSVPSALQVLESLSGDCNEHTVLYVALARALGLPARTAVGLVHIDGSFYYHAWPEVWLGEWVAMDPTLGQAPADASHLRFLIGGLARQVELIRLIGRLQLEVI
ncbi:MAG TPA: transglutaminase-like domain-containing protein [Longimicrobiales bacterium]